MIYPKELIINNKTTCNFSSNENFVVFECIYRLLEKGYKPEHLELEPTWKLGHGSKGGRADILVRDQQNTPLLLIECKTAGEAFEEAWSKTKYDGSQLFSYAQQQGQVKFICLYASNFTKSGIRRKAYLINLKDNQTQVELNKNKQVKRLFYKDAKDVKQLFKVWKETYQFDCTEVGIFEDDIKAYNIGKEKLTILDLKYITGTEMQTKFHEFAEILRRYSVSNKEAAFDKLINLFLCKIVDETQSYRNDTPLDFYWRGEYADNYFDLMDRLQLLYKEGMENYLGEKITYIDNQRVIDSFSYFIHDENATMEHVLDLFKQQKYYTNSDFSFIEVHNEKLFQQNARILLDVVKMWQYYQINGEQENQFLSDMFEFFLAKGFKQDEGQFFTPIPICRFIIHSLPIEQIIVENPKPPVVLDYACGAGHFLTEYATRAKKVVRKRNEKIRQYVASLNNSEDRNTNEIVEKTDLIQELDLKEYYRSIYGVEKEYRLSKVAKISAFMYGQDEINIIYADALDRMYQNIGGNDIGLVEEKANIIVANPPFAVEGFLKNLPQEVRKKYTLLDTVSDEEKNRNIQCFFIERTYQMLKPNGVTGIIVPNSVLSNPDTTHIYTREILLQYFDIVSIVELGNKTFGQTGTNTVILFLRKKSDEVKQAIQYKYRVNDFYNNWQHERAIYGGVYQDVPYIQRYCEHIEIPFETYEHLFEVTTNNFESIEGLMEYDMFKGYKAAFEKLTVIKKLLEKIHPKQLKDLSKTLERKINKKLTKGKSKASKQEIQSELNKQLPIAKEKLKAAQQSDLQKRFIEYITSIEKEKLYYFILAYRNPQQCLIVKTPNGNKEAKKFLGYEWSSSKGNEGIKYYGGETVHDINTPMFHPKNPQDTDKINYYIQQNFKGEPLEELPEHCVYADIVDMLDFSRVGFNKAFSLSPKEKIKIETRWELVKLGKVVDINKISKNPTQLFGEDEFIYIDISSVKAGTGTVDFSKKIKPQDAPSRARRVINNEDVLLSTVRPNLKAFAFLTNLPSNVLASTGFAVLTAKDNVLSRYIFELLFTDLLQRQMISKMGKGQYPSINQKDVENFKIPLPPLNIQQKIANECEVIDTVVVKTKTEVKVVEREINNLLIKNQENGERKKLGEICIMKAGKFVAASKIKDKNIGNLYPCYGGNGLRGYTKTFTHEGKYSLIGRQGALCGNVHLVEGKFHATEHAVVVTAQKEVNTNWLFYLLRSMNLNQYATGVAQPGLSVKNITPLHVKIPSLEQQEEIISQIAIFENRIKSAQAVIQEASAKKAAVMKKYL